MDWDKYHRAPVSVEFKVRRQATLILLKGEGEVGRLVAETSQALIKGLLDKVL
ncbi:MAG: hypothetical protein O2967_10995 [Proteobacteria bacterium]|nr:hypothetical protein [Pseudomonadota bacterium]